MAKGGTTAREVGRLPGRRQ